MAHNLTIRENGKTEFAFTGSRKEIWHGLGQELSVDAPIETWVTEAGLDWEVFESAVQYQSFAGSHTFPDKRVLFRSDTQAPLSVVSSGYHIVQPRTVLEFFRDLTQYNGFKLSAAGSMFGGKRFWATADVGKSFDAVDGDTVNGQLLLVTSVDGSIATVAKFLSTRVVCNNTLTVALGEASKNLVKTSHKKAFDMREVKIDLGILDEGWDKFMTTVKKLAEVEVSDTQVRKYFESKFYKETEEQQQGWGAVRKVNRLMELYNGGAGAEYSKGTAWGIINAVTDFGTHGSGKRDQSHQFWDGSFGIGEAMKNEVFQEFAELV
jgi:phage/plasmid-like protein (TIGR03299 family)